MKILILNTTILATGEITETETEIRTADAIYPKHVIPGWQIVEAEVPADYAPGKYVFDGGFALIPPSAEFLAAAKAAFIKQVDQDADAIIKSVMGERSTEYLLAEQEATAFKAGGYSGTAPGSVSSEATAKGVTAQVACDTILATASGWRAAQAALRAQRLLAKASAQTGQLDTVKASWSAFTAALKAQLGV